MLDRNDERSIPSIEQSELFVSLGDSIISARHLGSLSSSSDQGCCSVIVLHAFKHCLREEF